MNRLTEIEARLAEIKGLMSAEDANIDELNTETDSLLEERKGLLEAEQTRQARLAEIANGNVGTEIPAISEKQEKRTMENVIDTLEYRNAYLNNLRGVELSSEEKRSFVAASGAIATMTVNDIMAKVRQNAPLLEKCTVINNGTTFKYYVESVVSDATDHTELAAITEAEDALTPIEINPAELVKYVTISLAAKNMSVDAFENWLTSAVAEGVARKINAKIIGLFATAQSAGTSISAETVRALLGAVKGVNGLVCSNNTLFSGLLPLQDDSKNKLVTFVGTDAYVYGRPVMIDDHVDDGTIYAANFSKVIVGMADDITVTGGADLKHNAYEFLGTALFDCKLGYATAGAKIVASI